MAASASEWVETFTANVASDTLEDTVRTVSDQFCLMLYSDEILNNVKKIM